MPRPKPIRVLTREPAHSAEAIKSLDAGIGDFIEWANRARTGQTSHPHARAFDEVLTAFSLGRFSGGPVDGPSSWFAVASLNIRSHVRDGHWHLRLCPHCNRWLLAKDERRTFCKRDECVREEKRAKRASQRKSRRELDDGAARRTF